MLTIAMLTSYVSCYIYGSFNLIHQFSMMMFHSYVKLPKGKQLKYLACFWIFCGHQETKVPMGGREWGRPSCESLLHC